LPPLALALGLALALLEGCAAKRSPGAPAPTPPQALVLRAQELASKGKPEEARDLYLDVLREHPDDPAAFDARWGMAMLRLAPKSPLRDYRLALVNFERLIAKFGKSGNPRIAEAEAWCSALRSLSSCQIQGAKLANDVDRLRSLEADIDRLREVDLGPEVAP
jgi:hypothetical protein